MGRAARWRFAGSVSLLVARRCHQAKGPLGNSSSRQVAESTGAAAQAPCALLSATRACLRAQGPWEAVVMVGQMLPTSSNFFLQFLVRALVVRSWRPCEALVAAESPAHAALSVTRCAIASRRFCVPSCLHKDAGVWLLAPSVHRATSRAEPAPPALLPAPPPPPQMFRALIGIPCRLLVPHVGVRLFLFRRYLRACWVTTDRDTAVLYAPVSPRYGFEVRWMRGACLLEGVGPCCGVRSSHRFVTALRCAGWVLWVALGGRPRIRRGGLRCAGGVFRLLKKKEKAKSKRDGACLLEGLGPRNGMCPPHQLPGGLRCAGGGVWGFCASQGERGLPARGVEHGDRAGRWRVPVSTPLCGCEVRVPSVHPCELPATAPAWVPGRAVAPVPEPHARQRRLRTAHPQAACVSLCVRCTCARSTGCWSSSTSSASPFASWRRCCCPW